MRAVSDDQKLARRAVIMERALQRFMHAPYDAVTLAQVAEDCGLAKGTLFLYFATKESLFLALHQQALQRWFEAIDPRLTPRMGVDRCVAAIDETLAAQPELLRMLSILATALEHNISVDEALAFKQMLLAHVAVTGARIAAALGWADAALGARVLVRLQALVVGLWHQAEPAPAVRSVLARPELRSLSIDFRTELRAALRALIIGMKQEQTT
jgi:TetR/AcrR family transcriptional regulator